MDNGYRPTYAETVQRYEAELTMIKWIAGGLPGITPEQLEYLEHEHESITDSLIAWQNIRTD